MVVVTMSLVVIAMAVGWHFSCNDLSALCQTSKSFSILTGLFGLLGLGMGVFTIVEDRKGVGRRQPPSESREDG